MNAIKEVTTDVFFSVANGDMKNFTINNLIAMNLKINLIFDDAFISLHIKGENFQNVAIMIH